MFTFFHLSRKNKALSISFQEIWVPPVGGFFDSGSNNIHVGGEIVCRAVLPSSVFASMKASNPEGVSRVSV